MAFLYLKSLHIIFVVTWFAGLFYFPRLLIYHAEAIEQDKDGKDALVAQFKIMEKRLWYGITWPSAVLTLVFGLSLMTYFLPLWQNKWLLVKLGFVLGLFAYHFYCGKLFKHMQNDDVIMSSTRLRIWNEISTLFLIAIVFLVVVKNMLSMVYGIVGLVVISAIIMIAIRIYRKKRDSAQ